MTPFDYVSMGGGTLLILAVCGWLLWTIFRSVRQRYWRRRDAPKVDVSYCPEHDKPWVWVGRNGDRICAHWVDVALAEARHGCPQFKDE